MNDRSLPINALSNGSDPAGSEHGSVVRGGQPWIGPVVIITLGLLLYVPGVRWGLPSSVSWSQDSIAGMRTLGAVASWPDEWQGRYPPLHYLVLAAAYKPVLAGWERSGDWAEDPSSGQWHLRAPQAPKIGRLFLIARVVSVAMAIGAALGIWATTRSLTADGLSATLAAVVLMIGAAFVYFAHVGNVDVASIFWFSWSLLFFVRLLRSRHWCDALLLGLLGSLAISTKDAVAGIYPGMAVVLLAAEIGKQRQRLGTGRALIRAVLQARWLLGIGAFALPYLVLYGALDDPHAYVERMRYWLNPAAGSVHARQLRCESQWALLLATGRYAAGAVGWPMLAAMACSCLHVLRRHTRTALVMLTPALSYYLVVIAPIHFVYSRFLFPPIALTCVLTGIGGAALLRRRSLPRLLRLGAPALVLVSSFGYGVAVAAEMLTDSRYEAEAWFDVHVKPSSNIGAFSSSQYLPRLAQRGLPTYAVEMSREAFGRPQPAYLVLTSYNHVDFDEAQRSCMAELVGGRLGYEVVATFDGRFLGTGRSWLSLAGWGAPVPGKISPSITILRGHARLETSLLGTKTQNQEQLP